MPILLILTVAIQAFFIFHVFRTGRPYWWAYIILAAPGIGSLVYYFVEIFPNSRQEHQAKKAARDIARALKPDAELQRRTQELEICGSMDNKMALAEECEAVGMYDESARLYRSCLAGAYANDPQIIFRLAVAELMREELAETAALLQRLEKEHPKYKPLEVKLLRARLLEKTDAPAALTLYEALAPIYTGLEVKCRYAALLRELGQETQARNLFEEIVQHAKRYNIQHEGEREWVRYAKAELRA
ncbi:MAG: hypothetical protein LBV44_05225 [Methylobacillus sp.]|jgi:hypothetical protein|nr:hypothetical protein [Methylobacillus sp.]